MEYRTRGIIQWRIIAIAKGKKKERKKLEHVDCNMVQSFVSILENVSPLGAQYRKEVFEIELFSLAEASMNIHISTCLSNVFLSYFLFIPFFFLRY